MIARNYDWFIALFVPVVIGRSNCFGFGFFDSRLKTALIMIIGFGDSLFYFILSWPRYVPQSLITITAAIAPRCQ